MIPKTVFVLWHSSSVPILVKRCIHTMQVFSGCKVYFLTFVHALKMISRKSFPEYIEKQGYITTKSDYLRANLLARYGGIYLDASCIVLKDMSAWVDFSSNDVHMFENPNGQFKNVAELWAIAAPAMHPTMIAWVYEIEQLMKVGRMQYFREYKPVALYRTKYFEIGAALDVARRQYPSKQLISSVQKYTPLYYRLWGQHCDDAFELLVSIEDTKDMYMIKLTSDERQNIRRNYKRFYESILGRHLLNTRLTHS